MIKNILFLILIFLFSACESDDNSRFIDGTLIVRTCEEVIINSGDTAIANTANPEDTQVLITHDLDNKRTLKVLKGEVKLIRAK